MSHVEKANPDGSETLLLPEFMSTHPDSLKRAEHLDFLLPQVDLHLLLIKNISKEKHFKG